MTTERLLRRLKPRQPPTIDEARKLAKRIVRTWNGLNRKSTKNC